MDIKNIFKLKNLYIVLISFILCFIFSRFMVSISLFSENIYIIKDDSYEISFDFPFNVKSIPVSSMILDNQVKNNSEENTLMLTALGVPFRRMTVTPIEETEVVACGITVGVKIETDGVLVLGTGQVVGEDGRTHKPSEGLLKPGDMLLTANGVKLESKEILVKIINENPTEIKFTLRRDGKVIEEKVIPIRSGDNSINKIGLWVRDSTQGIGTITYYNPQTGKFGALGHGVIDVDTKELLPVGNGTVMRTSIKAVKEGRRGVPGELVGDINRSAIIGDIKINNEFGLYGNLSELPSCLNSTPMRIGLQNEVREGPATIRANIEGTTVKEYDVYIESVNRLPGDDLKGMIIRVTDTELLSKTGGIVQGMSGSPIIQNGKIIGAVTHVFIQDPTRGYGIFIENMLRQEKLF